MGGWSCNAQWAEEAVTVLRRAARLRPQSAEAFSHLGLALQQAGHGGEAWSCSATRCG